jgi:hypothetical protein
MFWNECPLRSTWLHHRERTGNCICVTPYEPYVLLKDTVIAYEENVFCKICGFHGGDWEMPSFGMWHRVTLGRTDVSEERIASIIRVETISELVVVLRSMRQFLVITNVVPSPRILSTLILEATRFSETSVLPATRHHIPEDSILQNVLCLLHWNMICRLRTYSDCLCVRNMSPVRFEVFTAVTVKNGVFWDVTPCGYCKNRRCGGT